jgi:hypothetical protein
MLGRGRRTSCRSRSMVSSFCPWSCSSASVLAASSFVRSAVCRGSRTPGTQNEPVECSRVCSQRACSVYLRRKETLQASLDALEQCRVPIRSSRQIWGGKIHLLSMRRPTFSALCAEAVVSRCVRFALSTTSASSAV